MVDWTKHGRGRSTCRKEHSLTSCNVLDVCPWVIGSTCFREVQEVVVPLDDKFLYIASVKETDTSRMRRIDSSSFRRFCVFVTYTEEWHV